MSLDVETARRPLRADAERNRRRIIAAAAEVFAARGLDAGLDEIARRAGVGIGTVYRRFPGKSALVDALFEGRIDAMVGMAVRAVAQPDSWVALTGFLESAVRMQVEDRALTDLLFSNPPGSDRLVEARHRLLPAVSALVERARDDGHLRPDVGPTDIAVLQFMLVKVGWFCRPTRPDHWRRQLGIMLDGLRVQRDAPTPLPAPAMTADEFDTDRSAGAMTTFTRK